MDSGILNAMLALFRLPLSRWLNDSHIALFCVAAVAVWKSLGYYLIIVMASVRAIPSEILEAAQLDNTPAVKKFFRITLPMISPQLFFLLITITISSFKVFDMIQVMTDGGPGNATDVLVTYIYRYAFEMNAKVGYASAAGTILFADFDGSDFSLFSDAGPAGPLSVRRREMKRNTRYRLGAFVIRTISTLFKLVMAVFFLFRFTG